MLRIGETWGVMTAGHSVDIVVRGSSRIDTMLCAESSLQRAVESKHGASASVRYEADSGVASLLADQRSGTSSTTSDTTNLVILSVDADVTAGDDALDPGAFRSSMIDAIQRIKESSGARVIVMNASSYDPTETISNHQLADSEPLSVRAHRLNLEAMRLSFDEGISVLDIDRIIAEMGGKEHVSAFLEYSPEARAAIVDELVAVIDDYGYFDDRPILEQVGSAS